MTLHAEYKTQLEAILSQSKEKAYKELERALYAANEGKNIYQKSMWVKCVKEVLEAHKTKLDSEKMEKDQGSLF